MILLQAEGQGHSRRGQGPRPDWPMILALQGHPSLDPQIACVVCHLVLLEQTKEFLLESFPLMMLLLMENVLAKGLHV